MGSNPTRELSPRKLFIRITCYNVLRFKGVASGKQSFREHCATKMLLEANPRNISASKISHYTVLVISHDTIFNCLMPEGRFVEYGITEKMSFGNRGAFDKFWDWFMPNYINTAVSVNSFQWVHHGSHQHLFWHACTK